MTDNLEQQRRHFSDTVVDLAAKSRTNDELLERLAIDLELAGVGKTRRVYRVPDLDLVIKMEREPCIVDPPADNELGEAGFTQEEIDQKTAQVFAIADVVRRCANLSELVVACRHRSLVPKIFGFAGAFGWIKFNPSVLISELVRTLDNDLPGHSKGVQYSDLAVDPDTGLISIFDPRLNTDSRPENFLDLPHTLRGREGVWLGNVGRTSDGRYVISDTSSCSAAVYEWVTNYRNTTPPEVGAGIDGTSQSEAWMRFYAHKSHLYYP